MPITTQRSPIRYAEIKRSNGSTVDEIDGFGDGIQLSRSWRAIITMVSALLLGILFATAQHLLNDYLDGQDIDIVHISSRWVSRINTALAFLVKTCLVTTIGVAFVQRQWLNLHHESLRVKEIDGLTGILGNIFCFFGTSVWFRHPLLTLIALVAWVTPIAMIITPGSISVYQSSVTNVTDLRVPQYNWSGTAFSILPIGGGFGKVYAQTQTVKIAFASAMAASTLSLPSQFQNQSYQLTFYAPAVQCGVADSSVRQMIALYRNDSQTNPEVTTYLSWVPGDEYSHGLTLTNLENRTVGTQLGSAYASLDTTSTDAARIYTVSESDHYQDLVTECVLHNATYSVDFGFTYPRQQHNITSVQLLNPVAVGMAFQSGVLSPNGQAFASYAAVMDAFGRLLVGSSSNDQYGDVNNYQTSYSLLSIAWDNADSVHQGLESLFQNITLSFLSSSNFTQDSTEAALVPVTATFYPVKYIYTPWELWLAYGISIFVAMICLIVGVHAFMKNEGSYQNLFSTFVRATSHHELREHVDSRDSCADPLPKDLGNTKVQLRRN